MTLTQLEYILAVGEHQHFGKAAKSCFVTQPTLSLQIQKLEEELGQKIFNRESSPIAPTNFGKKVLERSKQVISQVRDLESMARGEIDEVSGKIEVGVIPTIAPYLIPLFAKNFVKAYPKAQITFHELQTEEILTSLKSEKIDLAILSTPLSEKGMLIRQLFYEPFLIYLSAKNALMKKSELSEQDLTSQKSWLLKEGHCLRQQFLNICHADAINSSSHLHFEAGSMETLKSMVDVNEGFTLFPQLAVNRFHKSDLERVRPFKGQQPVREVSFMYRENFSRMNFLTAIEEEILKALPENVEIAESDVLRVIPLV